MTFVSMGGEYYKKFREGVKIEGMIREDNGDYCFDCKHMDQIC